MSEPRLTECQVVLVTEAVCWMARQIVWDGVADYDQRMMAITNTLINAAVKINDSAKAGVQPPSLKV